MGRSSHVGSACLFCAACGEAPSTPPRSDRGSQIDVVRTRLASVVLDDRLDPRRAGRQLQVRKRHTVRAGRAVSPAFHPRQSSAARSAGDRPKRADRDVVGRAAATSTSQWPSAVGAPPGARPTPILTRERQRVFVPGAGDDPRHRIAAGRADVGKPAIVGRLHLRGRSPVARRSGCAVRPGSTVMSNKAQSA